MLLQLGLLVLQSLNRLGGSILGVDASVEAIGTAQLHKQGDASLSEALEYRQGTAEGLQDQGTAHPSFRIILQR